MGLAQVKSCSYIDESYQIDSLIDELFKMKGAIKNSIECTQSTIFDSETGTIRDIGPDVNIDEPKSEDQVKEKKEGQWVIKNGNNTKYFSSTSKLTDTSETQKPSVITQKQFDTWEFNYKRDEMLKQYRELLNRIEMALLAMSKLSGCDCNKVKLGEGLEQAKENIYKLVDDCILTINTNAISLITGLPA